MSAISMGISFIKSTGPSSVIKISKAIVTRIKADQKEPLLGLSFDINNKKMISKNDANDLTEIIYDWIKQIVGNL